MLFNVFFLAGEVHRVKVVKGRGERPPSAVLTLQYGPQRETSGGAVEFVNAVQIRVPSYKYGKVEKRLKEGAKIQVAGRLQGVFKPMMDASGFLTAELVAERIDFENAPDTEEDPEAGGLATAEGAAA